MSGQMGGQPGGQAGGSAGGQDYLDKAVAMAEKKMGVNMSAAQNEKWTDKIRMMIEKWTGKKVPAKFSN